MLSLVILDDCVVLLLFQNFSRGLVQGMRREYEQVAFGNGRTRIIFAFSFSAFGC